MYPVQYSREQRWNDKAEQEENLQREERASVNSCRETGEHPLSSTSEKRTNVPLDYGVSIASLHFGSISRAMVPDLISTSLGILTEE